MGAAQSPGVYRRRRYLRGAGAANSREASAPGFCQRPVINLIVLFVGGRIRRSPARLGAYYPPGNRLIGLSLQKMIGSLP